MKNNNWGKVNFVVAVLLGIGVIGSGYYQLAGSNVTMKNTLAQNEEWIDAVPAPMMAAAEIIDEPQEELVVSNELVSEVVNVSLGYKGDEIKFSLETNDKVMIDWGDGRIGEFTSGDVYHKYDTSGEYTIRIEEDKITSLDISGVKGINELDLYDCYELLELNCGNSELSKLKLRRCTNLIYLVCNNTNIRWLDLSECPNLEYLYYGEGIEGIELNSECRTRLKLSGSSETTISYINQDEELPEFKLDKSNMTIDLGENYEKYEFAIISNSEWYKNNAYLPANRWYSAASHHAVRDDNKLCVSNITTSNWDGAKGVTIREKYRDDKGEAKVSVPKYRVNLVRSNGINEIHEFIPLQKVDMLIEVEEGQEDKVEVTGAVNIDKNDIIITKHKKAVRLRFAMPRSNVSIMLSGEGKFIPVENVEIGYSNLHVSLAGTTTFTAEITPSNATDKNITWESSDERIATIDENGNMTPHGVGKTIITARTSDGKRSSCDLTIYTLKYESTILDAGTTECIVHGAEKLNSFASSNPEVASVDQAGNVTAISAGEATITARDNNNTEIKCVITVKGENTVIEPVVLEMTPNKSVFGVNDVIKLSVKSGTLQGSEAIIWHFELDGIEIATNSGYSMDISKLIYIAGMRYEGDIYNKEITLNAFPRDVRDNSDRETTTFKFKICEEENNMLTSWENSKVVIGDNTYKLAEDVQIYMNNIEIENMNKVFEILKIEDPTNFAKRIKVNNMERTYDEQEITNLALFVSGNYDEINTKEAIVRKAHHNNVYLSNGESINYEECKFIKDNETLQEKDFGDIVPGDVATILYSDGYAQYVYISSDTVEGKFERFGKDDREIVIGEEKYYPSIDEILVTSGDFKHLVLLRDAADYIGENVKLHLNACGEYALMVVEKVNEDWMFGIVTQVSALEDDEEDDGIFYIPVRILLADGTISREYKFIFDEDEVAQSLFDWENEVKKLENEFIAFIPNEKGEILLDSDVLNLNHPSIRFGDNYVSDSINSGTIVDTTNKTIGGIVQYTFDDNTVIFNGGYDDETKKYSPEIVEQWDLLIKDNRLNQRTYIVREKDTKYIAYVYVDSIENVSSDALYAIVLEDDYKEKVGSSTEKFVEFITPDGLVTLQTNELDKDYVVGKEEYFVEYNLIGTKLENATALIDVEGFNRLNPSDMITSEIVNGKETMHVIKHGSYRVKRPTIKSDYKVIDTQKLLLEYEEPGVFAETEVAEDAIIYQVYQGDIKTITFEDLRATVDANGSAYVIPYANSKAPGYGTDDVEANILVVIGEVKEANIISDTLYAIVLEDDYKEKVGSSTEKFVEFITPDGLVTLQTNELDKDYVVGKEEYFVEYNLIGTKLENATALIDVEGFNRLNPSDIITSEIVNGKETMHVIKHGSYRVERPTIKSDYRVIDTQKLLLEYEEPGVFAETPVAEDAIIYQVYQGDIRTITFEDLRATVDANGYAYVIPYANKNAFGYGTDDVEANILVVIGKVISESQPIREFKDVKEGSWYYDIVTKTDYLEGTTKITFSPDDPLTREMFIAALHNIAGQPNPNGVNAFPDIPLGSWSEDAIVWASENDLVSGFPDGRFKPSENITRQEAIVVLKKYAEYENHSTESRADLTSFIDQDTIYDWAVESISWAVAEKVVSGDTQNALSPTKDLTRAETMAIFDNLLKVLK